MDSKLEKYVGIGTLVFILGLIALVKIVVRNRKTARIRAQASEKIFTKLDSRLDDFRPRG